MQDDRSITFGRFRLDQANECLWQGTRAISLRPKAFAVLKLLLENPGRLVTKQQVLDRVWPGTFVSDAVLKDSIRQLREVLGDQPKSPTYIETAHRRGYRFIGKISIGKILQDSPRAAEKPEDGARVLENELFAPVKALGRNKELAAMWECLQQALQGKRQLVFVTGEAGIGKTTLVQTLLEQAAAFEGMWIARGQCLEHYGAGEAFLPVLDAFSRLSRGPDGAYVRDLLRQHAPTWLAQMPSLIPFSERDMPSNEVTGTSRERMLREMAEALEAMTAKAPLILLLEDLHWSDYSTLDFLAHVARRNDSARLLLIGTYRPVEVIVDDHPLKSVKRELHAHGLCKELPLEYLTLEVIAQYLSARFPGHELPTRLAFMIYRHTEGNPLFMVNVAEYLVDEGVIGEENGTWKPKVDLVEVELGVPENLKQLIERQMERLSADERFALEGASVVGMECSSVAIAAGLDVSTEWVETHCEELVRRHQFLLPARLVELPDGTITPRYRFSHVLYLEVPYQLISAMRRSQIHQRIAERGISIYGDHVSEIAAELAMHFEQARDWPRAVQYLSQAADNALYCSAYYEAAALARRGLDIIDLLPNTSQHAQQKATLQRMLEVSLTEVKNDGA
jgi:predicted ATPase/DNA-binding winged helix-turn-helix (wHTH) protein